MNQVVKQCWQISKTASNKYWITLAISFIVMMVSSLSLLSTFNIDDPNKYLKFFIRTIIDTLWFFLLAHLVLRSYLKLKVINRPLNRKTIINLTLMLLFLSVICFAGSMMLSESALFKDTDFHQMKLVNEKGEVDATFNNQMIWTVGVLNSLVLYLCWAFIYMLFHQHQSKKVLQQQMQQAQMQQLTNQLSPHFLFNTFNSIRALIYEDQDKAADTVTELSELFRTHLQAHLRVKSTLEEEWQVTEQYLGIEQIRLEERLSVKQDIDPALWQQQLPTLTLLTLIENAIKHGISPSTDNGYIEIKAEKHQQQWRLSVTNSYKPGRNTSGTKVGLANVESRLRLTYGNDTQFSYGANPQAQTYKATITLPLV